MVSESRISAGRRAGQLVYWLLVLFLVFAGVKSVVTQLFLDGGMRPSSAARTVCSLRLNELERELDAIAASFLPQQPSMTPDTQDNESNQRRLRLQQWDAEFRAAAKPCTSMGAAYRTLQRIRDRMEQELSGYQSELRHLKDWKKNQ